jgi:hypothetical protein
MSIPDHPASYPVITRSAFSGGKICWSMNLSYGNEDSAVGLSSIASLRFNLIWRVHSGLYRHVGREKPNISKKHIAPIFKVEE